VSTAAEATVELGRDDDALVWVRRGFAGTSGWQLARLTPGGAQSAPRRRRLSDADDRSTRLITRMHARRRIDHALDTTSLMPIAESVRRVLAEAAAAVVGVAAMTAVTASS
jgi:hypothetical protein